MAQTNSRKTGKKAAGDDSLLLRTLHGKLFSIEFLSKNWKSILLVTGLIILFIYNKYSWQTKVDTHTRLKKEIEVVRSEFIRERSTYTSRTRESGMQQMIDSLHLDLQVQVTPPYPIKYQ